ncbi:glycosyltransferase family 2 protein, partial [Candidatus Peregrinibacteria bacterium]|nr:glycosyltransferase family 2 protein [Candidatus Peregrinibacteria bacterium]
MPEIVAKAQMEKGPNIMHSGGHNALMRTMKGAYYLCASYDMWYAPDVVSRMVEALEKPENAKMGTATPKLRYWDFAKTKENDLKGSLTNRLDSCGIAIRKCHHFVDLGQGEEDRGQYDGAIKILGPSGALALFRRETLEDIAYQGLQVNRLEVFDETIHYKNDVDLAYRLQWAGWKTVTVPQAVAWHERQAKNADQFTTLLGRIVKSRSEKSLWARESSFFGQEVMLMKDFKDRGFSVWTQLQTILYRWASIVFVALFERPMLKQFNAVKEKRSEIQARRDAMKIRVPASEIEQLMI